MKIPIGHSVSPARVWINYSLSILAPLMVLVLRMHIAENFGNRPLLILFMLPIILCSLMGGLWPGITATTISALSIDYFAIPPVGSLGIAASHDLLQLLTLVACGCLVSLLSEQLRHRESKYRLLIEHQTDMVVKMNMEGRFTYVSPSYCRIFGMRERELLGKKFTHLVHEEDLSATLEALKALYFPPYRADIKLRAMTPEGYQWFSWQNTAVLGPDGKTEEIIGVVRDVSDKIKILNDLIQSQKDFASMFNAITESACLIDCVGQVLMANDTFCGRLGLTPNECFGKIVYDLLPEKFQVQCRIYVERLIRIKKQLTFDDGRDGMQLRHTLYPVIGQDGTVKRIAIFSFDITAQQASVEALKVKEERLRIIADNTYDWEYWRAPGGHYLWISPACKSITGYPAEQFMGEKMKQVRDIIHPDDRHLWENHIKEVEMAETGHKKMEFRIIKASGEPVWISHTCKPIYSSDGQFLGRRGCNRDITERRRALEELTRSQKNLADMVNWKDSIFNVPAVGILVVTEHRIITEVNKGFVEIFGYPPEEVIGVSVDVIHVNPEMSRAFGEQYWGGTAHQEVVTVEWQLKKKNEEIFWCALSGSALNMQDLHKGVVWIIQDISQKKKTEERLLTSDARLHRALEAANAGTWEWDFLTGENIWSDELFRLYDFDPKHDTASWENWRSSIVPEERDGLEQSVLQAAATHSEMNVAWRVNTSDGSLRWLMSRGQPQFDEQGRVIRYLGTVIDITEQKQAEESLLKLKNLLTEGEKIAHLGSFEYITATQQTVWSDEEFRIYGLEPTGPSPTYADMLSKCIHPDDADFFHQTFTDAMQRGSVYELEHRIVRPDNHVRWVYDRAYPYFDGNSNLVRYIGTTLDITERKQIEMVLRESELRFRTLFEQSMDAIAIMDSFPPRFRFVNPAFVQLFGYSEKEVCNLSGDQIWSIVYPEDLLTVQTSLKKRMEGKEISACYEFRIVRKNGEIRWVDTVGSRAQLGDKVINQSIYRDITSRKKAEEKQRHLQEQLIQAQKMESIGRLAGGVAHDYNNMLNVILGYTEMAMAEVGKDQHIYEDLAEVLHAAQRSTEITRQLLAFARKQTISPKILDLNDIITGMLKMLQRLIGEDINLSWNPKSRLWHIKMDTSQIDQILVNLCVNARDAIMDVGRITIETGNVLLDEYYCADHPDYNPGDFVMLSVSDNGCGMGKETLEHIFEPFFTTKGAGKGTGLGMATVYGIVKQNGGSINIYSEPGLGSTINIYFPRYVIDAAETAIEEKTQIPKGHGETLLFVEDEEAVRNMGKKMLEKSGYKVIAAGSADEAFSLFDQYAGKIDLLITDVVMPGMNGRELADRLHTLYPRLKVLFMSGYTADAIAHRGILDDGINFIHKPFSQKDLANKAYAALGATYSCSLSS